MSSSSVVSSPNPLSHDLVAASAAAATASTKPFELSLNQRPTSAHSSLAQRTALNTQTLFREHTANAPTTTKNIQSTFGNIPPSPSHAPNDNPCTLASDHQAPLQAKIQTLFLKRIENAETIADIQAAFDKTHLQLFHKPNSENCENCLLANTFHLIKDLVKELKENALRVKSLHSKTGTVRPGRLGMYSQTTPNFIHQALQKFKLSLSNNKIPLIDEGEYEEFDPPKESYEALAADYENMARDSRRQAKELNKTLLNLTTTDTEDWDDTARTCRQAVKEQERLATECEKMVKGFKKKAEEQTDKNNIKINLSDGDDQEFELEQDIGIAEEEEEFMDEITDGFLSDLVRKTIEDSIGIYVRKKAAAAIPSFVLDGSQSLTRGKN